MMTFDERYSGVATNAALHVKCRIMCKKFQMFNHS